MLRQSFPLRSPSARAAGAVAVLLVAGCSAGPPDNKDGTDPTAVAAPDAPRGAPGGLRRLGGRAFFENRDTVASLFPFTVVVARSDSDGHDDVLRARAFTDVDGYLYASPSVLAFATDPRMSMLLLDPPVTPRWGPPGSWLPAAEFGGYRSPPGRPGDDFVLRPVPLAFAATVVGASPAAVWVSPASIGSKGPIAAAQNFGLADSKVEGACAEIGLLSDFLGETVRVEVDERVSAHDVGRRVRRFSVDEPPTAVRPEPLHRLAIVVDAPEGVSPVCFYAAAAAAEASDDRWRPRFRRPVVRRCDARGVAEFDLPPGRWRLVCGSLYSEGVVEIDEVTLPSESPGATLTRRASTALLGARVARRTAFPGASGPVWGLATMPERPGLDERCDILFRADHDPESIATVGRVSTRFWDASLRAWASPEASADSGADGTTTTFGLDRLKVGFVRDPWAQTSVVFKPKCADGFSPSADRSVVTLREMQRVPSGGSARWTECFVRAENQSVELTRGAAYTAVAYRRSWDESADGFVDEMLCFAFIKVGRGMGEFEVETYPGNLEDYYESIRTPK